jgi:hypothetical protein
MAKTYLAFIEKYQAQARCTLERAVWASNLPTPNARAEAKTPKARIEKITKWLCF